jgi:spermidine synthase
VKIWIGEHEVASGQFALMFYGYRPESIATPARARALLSEACGHHLRKHTLSVQRRAPYLTAQISSPLADLQLRVQVQDQRLLITCHALSPEPHALIELLEFLAVRLDPREVELIGFPQDGRSGRVPYSNEGLLFARVTDKVTSSFQLIEVGDHPTFGRVLFLNGEAQIASSDEAHYSGQLVKGAVRRSTRRVLIMGGGDCGVLRQVLEHEQVEAAVMAEIDEAVVEASQQHFPEVVGSSLADPRAELVIGDAFAYVRDHGEFDLIVYDLSDTPLNLDGYGEVFPLINGALSKRGRVAVQCGSGMKQDAARLKEILQSMRKAFAKVKTKEVVVPSFVHRPWMFAYAERKA